MKVVVLLYVVVEKVIVEVCSVVCVLKSVRRVLSV